MHGDLTTRHAERPRCHSEVTTLLLFFYRKEELLLLSTRQGSKHDSAALEFVKLIGWACIKLQY